MASTTHYIDPDADTLLVLRNPGAPFAEWATVANDVNIEVKEKKAVDVAQPVKDTLEEEGIRYTVSSRHLALASGFFKSSLTKEGWVEGVPSKVDGKYHLTTYDWDPDVFRILLNVIHLRNRQVPRTVSLDTLAKFAVLVDYYRCIEAVEVYAEIWIEQAKKTSPIPQRYGRELMLWMCIAWVFRLKPEFETITDVAIKQCTTPTIRDMELPIPKSILDAIEHKRYQIIEERISDLHHWLDVYGAENYKCQYSLSSSFECSSILLGALTKEMRRSSLSPRPEVPFDGLSFEQLLIAIEGLKSPAWSKSVGRGYYGDTHNCNFSASIKKNMEDARSTITGLDMSEFEWPSEWRIRY
ncbi:hypothetical protein P280DRAFT_410777 [Massarina eburnea CBS 473.64]|uniref:Uncharacterized protein n=1 Tax=Massarina eburnea CBS 473.64 TaxID=1395130 RepID=A0A6A6RKP6_9PLEO|nr:hypothetical protein P280DRAFT_410777 [Massarina eburnea CBS 473.64]